MDYIAPIFTDCEVDLESGCSVSRDDFSSEETFSGVKKQAKAMLVKVCSRFIDRSMKSEYRENLGGNVSNVNGVLGENGMAKESKDGGKKAVKEKRKKSSNKKPPRPPKPPRGPSLDSADLKLIKEISELAMLKRARIERLKALKKMKAAKQSSSSCNLFAMVFTLLFCLVIFQGMSSRGTSVSSQGSPLSTGSTEGGLISVQFSENPSASYPNGPGPGSPNMVQQITGSDPQQKPI